MTPLLLHFLLRLIISCKTYLLDPCFVMDLILRAGDKEENDTDKASALLELTLYRQISK